MKRNILLFLIPSLFFACKQKKESIHPSFQPITHSVYASGMVKGLNQYLVFAKVSGVIEEIQVTEGDAVSIGQTLLRISNNAAKIGRENSEANALYNSEQNNQDRLQELKFNIGVLKEKLSNDSLLYLRQKNLWAQNVGTQLELEQKELNWRNSKANYDAALLRYNQLKKQLTFASKQSQLNFEISNSQINDLLVKSEINGKVYDVLKKKGEMVTAQTPVAVLGDAQVYYLELQVDEFDIAQVKVGQQIYVTMDSHRGEVFEATVSKIHPMMQEKTKTFMLEANFVKAPVEIYPNLTAEANIVISKKDKALLIPRNYLSENKFVLLESGEKREVKIGMMDYQKVEILQGLTETDALVKPE